MNSNREIMDGSRINSIIYRIGACLIVSSLLMSAVSANKQIKIGYEGGGGSGLLVRPRRGLSGGNLFVGQREKCNNEGEEFPTPKDFKCFQCICRNGFVECEPEQCPSVEDCYYLEKKTDGCCRRCKECHYNGTSFKSGTEWTDPEDPCLNYKCLAGVVTQVNLQCYTSCSALSPPSPDSNQCCPTCVGCKYNGQTVLDGREVTSSEDPCLKCQCKNRRLECIKKACPVLNCPQSKQKKIPGECCPRCTEIRHEAFTIPGKCILGQVPYNNGAKFTTHCANCVCQNGTVHCKRHTCPVLECPLEQQIDPDGGCCKKCPEVAELTSVCVYNKTTYQHDETWNMDSCRSCRCVNGRPNCAEMKCPAIRCRANEMKQVPAGQCCAKCVESAGICTVFGDPHYKTFDGKFFSFQGMCKYQLTSDCVGHTFSIRVTNDGRNTKSSSWTKTVTLKVNNLKVNLGQKMRVKVNGTRVDLPFILYSPTTTPVVPNSAFSDSTTGNSIAALFSSSSSADSDEYLSLTPEVEIRMTDEGVSVVTRVGVQLLWDGTNFLQVQAPVTYKNRLCGLCGNYNGVSRDDFKTRRGENMTENSVWKFANSWRVGGTKQCSNKYNENYGREPATCKYRKKKGMCQPLQGLDGVFESCKERVNPSNYIDSCHKDMCECESDLCYCDSYTAYAHECKRMGVELPDWRNRTHCSLQAMRNGALVVPLKTASKQERGHKIHNPPKVRGKPEGVGGHKKKPVELQRLLENIPPELIKGNRRPRVHNNSQHHRRQRVRKPHHGEGELRSDKRTPLPLMD